MVFVNEMELLELGQLCGIVGVLTTDVEKKLTDILNRSGCACILFCYRGKQDDQLVRFLQAYAAQKRSMRWVFINNEQCARRLSLSAQKMIDSIYSWVDMVLCSGWMLVDLPVLVAIHSDELVCLAEDSEVVMQKIRALRCRNVYKLS